MSLIHFYYNPCTEFDRLFDIALNSRFGPISSQVLPASIPLFRPKMDLRESEESNTVTATFELPGLKPEDIKIDLQQPENRLTVSGEISNHNHNHNHSSQEPEESGFTVRERHFGKFSRTLRLPFGTKPEDVKAKLENGLLTVTFPRTTAEQEPRRINIQ